MRQEIEEVVKRQSSIVRSDLIGEIVGFVTRMMYLNVNSVISHKRTVLIRAADGSFVVGSGIVSIDIMISSHRKWSLARLNASCLVDTNGRRY